MSDSTSRAQDSAASLDTTIESLERRVAAHNEALQAGDGDELDGAAVRALQATIAAARAATADLSRAQLVGEWTATRAQEILEPVDGVDAKLVEAPVAAPVGHYVDVELENGVARIASRAASEAGPGWLITLYAGDPASAGQPGPVVIADTDQRLRDVLTVLRVQPERTADAPVDRDRTTS